MEACWSVISCFFIRDTGRLDQASMLNIHRDVIAYLLEHTQITGSALNENKACGVSYFCKELKK